MGQDNRNQGSTTQKPGQQAGRDANTSSNQNPQRDQQQQQRNSSSDQSRQSYSGNSKKDM